jgi:hypothetical protein
MEQVIGAFVGIHLLGFASIFAGLISEMTNLKAGLAKVNAAVLHGAWLALVAGLVLAGLMGMAKEEINPLTLSIKGLAITGIFGLAYTYKNKENTPKWVVPVLMLLTLIALFTATIVGVEAPEAE